MGKREIIVCTFLLYAGILHWLTTLLIDEQSQNTLTPDNGDVNNIFLAAVYILGGLTIYFLTINATAILGILISWKRKDKVATSTFKLLTLLTLIGTTVFYLMNW